MQEELLGIGSGFPDFIAFRWMYKDIPKVVSSNTTIEKETYGMYRIIGVEVKSNGYLTKEEKEKCSWLIDNNIFSKILIAMKDKNKRGGIIYKGYEI